MFAVSCTHIAVEQRDAQRCPGLLRQVFIHDPLYKWALTPAKAQQRQRAHDEDGDAGAGAGGGAAADAAAGEGAIANADAERTVVRVKQKLQGLEGGAS